MIRRPPRSTRTDTLCPYTTLFRSKPLTNRKTVSITQTEERQLNMMLMAVTTSGRRTNESEIVRAAIQCLAQLPPKDLVALVNRRVRIKPGRNRSAESRVGKECVSKGRYRRSPDMQQNKKYTSIDIIKSYY